jgi:hypothetical protein
MSAWQGSNCGSAPAVRLISFARTDTNTPVPGTYALGGREGFRGTVEVYGSPQRDFDITAGDLVLTGVEGDALSGTFSLTAAERAEVFGSPAVEVRVAGSFRTRPVD